MNLQQKLTALRDAARDLLDEDGKHRKLRSLIYASLHNDPGAREWAARRIGRLVTTWLIQGNKEAVARLGRFTDEDQLEGLCRPDKLGQVYLLVFGSLSYSGILPTKEETARDAKLSLRTVREGYRAIQEQSGICLKESDRSSIWNLLLQD